MFDPYEVAQEADHRFHSDVEFHARVERAVHIQDVSLIRSLGIHLNSYQRHVALQTAAIAIHSADLPLKED